MKKTHTKFQNDQYKTVRGVALKRGTHCLYTEVEIWYKTVRRVALTSGTNFHNVESDKKNDLTIISKPHAHPHTMKETHTKFQNDRYKTVRGVALKRGTHCLYTEVEKWLHSQCGKSDKKCSNNFTKTTCTSSYHEENTCKVSKQLVQNSKRSCAHKRYPLSIYWGWKMTKFTMWKKWQKKKKKKKNLTVISKPHAHPHTIKNTHAKFQNDQYKTVREVALTRHPGGKCWQMDGRMGTCTTKSCLLEQVWQKYLNWVKACPSPAL